MLFLANGRQCQLAGVEPLHTSRHMQEYQMILPGCHGYCLQGEHNLLTCTILSIDMAAVQIFLKLLGVAWKRKEHS